MLRTAIGRNRIFKMLHFRTENERAIRQDPADRFVNFRFQALILSFEIEQWDHAAS